MPYQVKWYVDQRVIITQYTGIIEVEDIRSQIKQTNLLMQQGTPLIHSIIDLSQIDKWPPLNVVNEFRSMDISPLRDKIGWSIIVANNIILKFASSLFAPIFNLRQRIFSTLDEALAFLQEQDASLPPLKK